MVGSSVGERAQTPGLVAYSATKGAVKMFTQGLSREVGSRRITVNNVQPGPIDTDLNPAAGDWAVSQKAATALGRYGHVDGGRRVGGVRRRSGVLVHYRGESHR
jgi:3-oxoacyl-[acyl-carrier protein] reductase